MEKTINKTPTHTYALQIIGTEVSWRWRRINRKQNKCSNAFKQVMECWRAMHNG